ncbi:unnamed protein product [Sphagnum balticum]
MKQKKLPEPSHPASAEREYHKRLRSYAQAYVHFMKEGLTELVPELRDIIATELPRVDSLHKYAQVRKDANIEDKLKRLFKWVTGKLEVHFPHTMLEAWTLAMIGKVNRNSKNNVNKQFKAGYRRIGREAPDFEPFMRDGRLTPYYQNVVDENVGLIRSIPTLKLEAFKNQLVAMISSDQPHPVIQKAIMKNFDMTKGRAALIARDQVGKLNGALEEYRQKQLGVQRYVWRTSGDSRVRRDHKDLDGHIFSWDKPPIVDKKTGRRAHPKRDFQCLPGNALIGVDQKINRLFRRMYSGELTRLISSSGRMIETTPNHPILTNRGWIPAHQVDVGDNVFSTFEQGSNRGELNFKQAETRIEDLFESFRRLFPIETSSTIESDFHGDSLVDQKIEIINVQSPLVLNFKSERLQENLELMLSFASVPRLFDSGDIGNHPNSILSRLNELHSFLLGKFGHSDQVRSAAVSTLDSFLFQSPMDNKAAHSVFVRNGKLTHSADVIINRLLREIHSIPGYLPSFDKNTPSAEMLAEIIGVNSELRRDLFKKHSLNVEASRIVDKSSRKFSGHVYNLETDSNWYIAESLIIHNCRCWAEPVLEDVIEA